MMRNALVLLGLLALSATYTWYGDFKGMPGNSAMEEQQAKTGQPAPDFEFTDLKGQNHSLSSFKDKKIILNFWASWCAPCVVEFPQMLELAEQTKETTVFLFLSVDEDKNAMQRFLKKIEKQTDKENVHIAWDQDKSISQDLYQTYKLPETYLISPGLIIKDKIIGLEKPWNDPSMIEKINRL